MDDLSSDLDNTRQGVHTEFDLFMNLVKIGVSLLVIEDLIDIWTK